MSTETVATASQIWLVRHALPLSASDADPGLSEVGHRQARSLARWIEREPVAQFVASPYRRAHETALAVALPHERNVVIDSDLREWDSDRTTYATPESIAHTPQGLAFAEGRYADFVPRYDRHALADRMIRAVTAAAGRAPGEISVVVSHGGAINTLLAHVVGANVPFFFDPGYSSVSRLAVFASGRLVLRSCNETAHLRGLEEPERSVGDDDSFADGNDGAAQSLGRVLGERATVHAQRMNGHQ